MGLLYADGCNYEKKGIISISLKEEDSYLLNLFLKELDSDYILYTKLPKSEKHSVQKVVSFVSRKMSNVLKGYGMVGNKSLTLLFPNENVLSKKFYPDFLRGLFDGDGSCSVKKITDPKLSFVGSKNICDSFLQILQVDGLIPTKTKVCMRQRLNKNVHYEISIGGTNMVRKTLIYLLNNSELYMKRKYKIINKEVENEL